MKKGMLLGIKGVLPVLSALWLAGCASGPSVAPEPADRALLPGKAAFEAKCGLCHGIDRALGKNKVPAEWEKTVTRMQAKVPDRISAVDVRAILAYLNAVQGPQR